MSIRESIIEKAKDTVTVKHKSCYGELENNFYLISQLWSAYLGDTITSDDVAIMMVLLKCARAKTGEYNEDNYIDMIGYAACAAESNAASTNYGPKCVHKQYLNYYGDDKNE